jgi:4-hydroxy-tetrahydrodipicolinate synthase
MKVDWMRGCATALVTPFKGDGSFDEDRMRALVDRQIKGGVQLLVPCGTTGESATMTEEEDARVIATTIEVARGRAKVIAGAGSNSTASAIEYSQRARDLGADAVLQVAPWYNKPTQEGLYAHFSAIAGAVPEMPIMLYNVPGRTSSNIAAPTTLRLARDCENIVAIKEASESAPDHGNSARASRELFRFVRRRRGDFTFDCPRRRRNCLGRFGTRFGSDV